MPATLRHEPGLAASPRVRYILDMGGKWYFPFARPLLGGLLTPPLGQNLPLTLVKDFPDKSSVWAEVERLHLHINQMELRRGVTFADLRWRFHRLHAPGNSPGALDLLQFILVGHPRHHRVIASRIGKRERPRTVRAISSRIPQRFDRRA